MAKKSIDRRQFIKHSLAFGALASGCATMPAKTYQRIVGANERVNMGVIGCGGMANHHMNALLKMKDTDNVDIISVCDIFTKRMDAAAQLTGGRPVKNYSELLENPDIDSVLIATPEHWHHRMTLDTINAGKHIYVEKPMTHTIPQAKEVVQAVDRSKLKVQVGVQGMSDDSYATANKYINDGVLGKVIMAHIDYSRNYAQSFWTKPMDPDAKPGVNLDWKAWLGPAPARPWDPMRYFSWRLFWDYSGGIATDLFIHRITRLIRSIGLEFPKYVVASGGQWNWPDSRAEIPDTFNMLVDYPKGPTLLVVSSMANDTPIRHIIRGHKATLEFTKDGFVITPQKATHEAVISGTGEKLDDNHIIRHQKTGAEDVTLHHRNLLAAIRKDEPLKCDIHLGYYGTVACMMGNLSLRNRSYMYWDGNNQKTKKA